MRVTLAVVAVAVTAVWGTYRTLTRGAERFDPPAVAKQSWPSPEDWAAPAGADATPAIRVFSPRQPLLTPHARAPYPTLLPTVTGTVAPTLSRIRADGAGGEDDGVVVPAVEARDNLVPAIAPSPEFEHRPKTARPATKTARTTLVRNLQRELRRVGCYQGGVDGSWNQETRRSMATFTGLVVGAIPVDEPHYVMLALLQTHDTDACVACPASRDALPVGSCSPAMEAAAQPATAERPMALTSHDIDQRIARLGASHAITVLRDLPRAVETGALPATPPTALAASPADAAPTPRSEAAGAASAEPDAGSRLQRRFLVQVNDTTRGLRSTVLRAKSALARHVARATRPSGNAAAGTKPAQAFFFGPDRTSF